jgi:hypothetical protein
MLKSLQAKDSPLSQTEKQLEYFHEFLKMVLTLPTKLEKQ